MSDNAEAEDAHFFLEGAAYQTLTLSWMETDERGVRWEHQQTITAAGVLDALRQEQRAPTQSETPEQERHRNG